MDWRFFWIMVGIVLPVFVFLAIGRGVHRDQMIKNKPLPEWYVKYVEPISETLYLLISLILVCLFSCNTANAFVALLYSKRYAGFDFRNTYPIEWRIGFILGLVLLFAFAVMSVLVYLRRIRENNSHKTTKVKYVECLKTALGIIYENLIYEVLMERIVYEMIFIEFDIIWYLLIKWGLFFVIRIRALRKLLQQPVQVDE